MLYSGKMSQHFQNWKNNRNTTSVLKYHCYCPILLMRTTKTAVCLQTKAICHNLNGVELVFRLNFTSNTLAIAITRLLE